MHVVCFYYVIVILYLSHNITILCEPSAVRGEFGKRIYGGWQIFRIQGGWPMSDNEIFQWGFRPWGHYAPREVRGAVNCCLITPQIITWYWSRLITAWNWIFEFKQYWFYTLSHTNRKIQDLSLHSLKYTLILYTAKKAVWTFTFLSSTFEYNSNDNVDSSNLQTRVWHSTSVVCTMFNCTSTELQT